MKTPTALVLLALLTPTLLAAADLAAEVKAAARKLADQSNYRWVSKPKSDPEFPNFRIGPTEGQAEKGGFTHASFTYNDSEVELAFKDGKGAIKLEDEWNSESDLEGDREWIARRLKIYKSPAGEAEELAGLATQFKAGEAGVISAELGSDAAKEILRRISRRAAEVKDARGSAKFWIKDGLLIKYEFAVQAKVTVNDEEVSYSRTTTVEVSDVGKTKVSIPDAAKAKLS